MPYGTTQCYLPPGRGDIPAFTPAEAGTRLSDPRMDARLSWPTWLVTYRDVIPARRRSPIIIVLCTNILLSCLLLLTYFGCLQRFFSSLLLRAVTIQPTVSWPLYSSTCAGRHLPLRTGEFCWCKVVLPTCPCWRQPVHSDQGEDAGRVATDLEYSGISLTMENSGNC